MIGARQRQFVERKTEPVPPCVQRAVVQLAEAHDYARDVQAELWQYAVEIESLMVTGAGVEDLQWLVQGGYVEHAREVTRPKDACAPLRRVPRVEFRKEDVLRVDRGGAAVDVCHARADAPATGGLVRPKSSNSLPANNGDVS